MTGISVSWMEAYAQSKDNDGHWYDDEQKMMDEHDSNDITHAGIQPQNAEVVYVDEN